MVCVKLVGVLVREDGMGLVGLVQRRVLIAGLLGGNSCWRRDCCCE